MSSRINFTGTSGNSSSGNQNTGWQPPNVNRDENCNNGTANENTMSCAICMSLLERSNHKARPDCCGHMFCLNCLAKWCKRSNTCPVDRKMFRKILVINNKNDHNADEDQFDAICIEDHCSGTHCVLCRTDDDTKSFTDCSQCLNLLHNECRGVGLVDDNIREWLCPSCDVPPRRNMTGSRRAGRTVQFGDNITVELVGDRTVPSRLINALADVLLARNTAGIDTGGNRRGVAAIRSSSQRRRSSTRGRQRSQSRSERSRSPLTQSSRRETRTRGRSNNSYVNAPRSSNGMASNSGVNGPSTSSGLTSNTLRAPRYNTIRGRNGRRPGRT